MEPAGWLLHSLESASGFYPEQGESIFCFSIINHLISCNLSLSSVLFDDWPLSKIYTFLFFKAEDKNKLLYTSVVFNTKCECSTFLPSGEPDSFPRQFMQDLCWTKLQWSKFLWECFSYPALVSFHQCPIPTFDSPTTNPAFSVFFHASGWLRFFTQEQ